MKFERNDIFTGLFVLVGTVFGLSVLLFIAGYNLLDDRTSLYRYHDTYDSPGFRNLRFRPRTTGLTLEYSF